jgi:uncharacterized membrane protein YbhN (UPF0104 family)
VKSDPQISQMTQIGIRTEIVPGKLERKPSPRWRLLARLIVSAGVLAWLAWRIEWRPIAEAFARVNFGFCLLALFVYCLAQVVSSVRWKLLARPLGFHEPLPRYVSLYFIGMFFNLFLPTSMGGDVVRGWYLGNSSARALAFLSVVSERFAGLLALMLVASLAACANPAGLPAWAPWLVWGLSACGGLGLITLPLIGRYHGKLRMLAEGLSLFRKDRSRWLAGFALEVWLLGLALDLQASLLLFAVAAPLVTLFTMLPITLNGVGVREGALVLLLAPAGIAPAEALALGVLWFCVLAAAGLLGGMVYLAGSFSVVPVADSSLPSGTRTGMGTGTGAGTRMGMEGNSNGSLGHHSDQGRAGQSSAAA